MHYTIEELLKSNAAVITWYENAVTRWNDILVRDGAQHIETLAQIISGEQMAFEQDCGGRWIGQEIMAVVGIARYYSKYVGFQDTAREAKLVYDAILASSCSVEVKGHARTVAELYDLQEEAELHG